MASGIEKRRAIWLASRRGSAINGIKYRRRYDKMARRDIVAWRRGNNGGSASAQQRRGVTRARGAP
jgi:hypothetical protein